MKHWLLALALAVTLTALVALAQAQQYSALEAYQYVIELSRLGANVSLLVDELNRAIYLESQGYGANASLIISNVVEEAIAELPGAEEMHLLAIVGDYASLAVAVIIIAVVYVKRRELVGGLWLRVRGSNRVRGGGPGRPRTFLFDSEVLSVVLALVIVLVTFVAAQSFVGANTQPFTAIAILGPSGKIGGYPSTVLIGQPINLYIYVYNHMGVPTWLVVRLYVTNNTGLEPPLNITPIAVYQRILLNNESWLIPITITLNSTGTYRLIGELWMYSPSNLTLTYTGNYVQLWINVTQVMPSG
ncbi:MAG: DUF1616 domain-containing protein [Vulcanisaeta sp.]|nr:DUF1616 domain-containing protein [Vulcanisaeta sp.]MCG2894615.1 DUF1616 domain-containing protein [Vulcanisaeta sp.]